MGRSEELESRIAHYIDTGKVITPIGKQYKSSFHWRNEELAPGTIITDNYSNLPNMRSFTNKKAGDRFSFSNEFMQWMRDNTGKTLGDALTF